MAELLGIIAPIKKFLSNSDEDILLSSKLNTASSVTLKQVFYSA